METLALVLLAEVATLIPMWRLVDRAGYNPKVSLACLIPGGLIVLLWLVAFRPKAGVALGDGNGR